MLEIPEKEISSRLLFDNPWWEIGEIESRFIDLPRRHYFSSFCELVGQRQVNRAVILMGPRRVGKTVMVFQAIQELIENGSSPETLFYLSLDTPFYTGLSLQQLVDLFLHEFGHKKGDDLYIFFDEIQYLKNWEVHLKALVDSYPTFKFVATGSAAAALRLKSNESGAGRFTDFLLPPLTFSEYLAFIGRSDELVVKELDEKEEYFEYETKDIGELNREFVNYLNFGGYPEAVMSDVIRKDSSRYIKSDIIDKVLLRDLPSLYGIQDIQELNRLFMTIAYNTGNEVSLEMLASSSGVAKNTLRRYIEYLEAAFLIRIVHRVDNCAKKFTRANFFKVYLTNPSMRAALFGPIDASDNAMSHLTETAIYSQWFHSEVIDLLYYARWNGGEVDIVCIAPETQRPQFCIEVKWSDKAVSDKSKIKSLITFCRNCSMNSVGRANTPLVTTKTKTASKTIEGQAIEFMPSALYAYLLGNNILASPRSRRLFPAEA